MPVQSQNEYISIARSIPDNFTVEKKTSTPTNKQNSTMGHVWYHKNRTSVLFPNINSNLANLNMGIKRLNSFLMYVLCTHTDVYIDFVKFYLISVLIELQSVYVQY